MAVKPSLRKTAPRDDVFEARRTWGGRLLVELNAVKQTPEWLGAQVEYEVPSSMRQVINGHQGISREVYEKILQLLPEMVGVAEPPIAREKQGVGAPGPHKTHVYPKIGSIAKRRAF
jgi:hypothetical protein